MTLDTYDCERAHALATIQSNLLRLKWLGAAARFERALKRHDWALKYGYNDDQPRVPAGSREGGQWTSRATKVWHRRQAPPMRMFR